MAACTAAMGWAQAALPLTLDIADEAAFAAWTVIDNNADISPNTWTCGTGEAVYSEDKSCDADDWLIAPAVTLEAGVTYTIDYYIVQKSTFNFDKQRYAITVGTAATIEAQTTVLTVNESFSSKLYAQQTTTFTPAASGTYHLGVHLYSNRYSGDCGFQKFVVGKATVLPSHVTGLTATADADGALRATLAWTMPTISNYGGTLEQVTGAWVLRDGEQIADLPAAVGQAMTYDDTALDTPGRYTYSVVAYNADGEAPGTAPSATTGWVGHDTPMAVSDFTATANGPTVTLTWTAPDTGTQGGYVDPAAFTYRIERNGEVLEQAWSGQLSYTDTVDALAHYTYRVAATYDGRQGASATTRLLAGNAMTVPYSESFATSDAMDFFTTPTNTTRGWSYYASKQCAQFWGGTAPVEAWLITPAIAFESGKTYKLTFRTGLENAVSADSYKHLYVTLGQGTEVEAQATELWDETIQSALMTGKDVYFTVPASGSWNIGFCVRGATNTYAIFVDDITVTESQVIPQAATDLTAMAAAAGELKATVRWTNPAADLAGTPLAALSSVELYRGEELLKTYDNPTVGAEMEYADINIPAPGIYTYAVVARVEDRASDRAEAVSGWIGIDTPAPVTELTLTAADTHPLLNWTAPDTGVHGGYINADALTYTVVRHPGDITLAEGLTATTFTDEADLPLANYRYSVYAVIGDSLSEGVTSNAMVFGGAFELPYEARLDDADEAALWTVVDANADGKTWTYGSSQWAYTSFSAADDYLFTPPLRSLGGTHKLTLSVKGYNYRYSDAFEVLLATGTDLAAADTTVLFALEDNAVQSAMLKEYTVEFQAPAGIWHIVLRDKSTDPWGLTLGALRVERTDIGMAGDLNGDGAVDVEDVNLIINVILECTDVAQLAGNADLNGDGAVDVEDLNAIINIILM